MAYNTGGKIQLTLFKIQNIIENNLAPSYFMNYFLFCYMFTPRTPLHEEKSLHHKNFKNSSFEKVLQ